jgi:integrase
MPARMPVELKGLHSTKKMLADGSVKRYFYAWKNGPRILAEYGTPAFVIEFHEHHKALRQPDDTTVASIITHYKATELPTLKPSTRKDYTRYIALIETEFGDMPLSSLSERGARAIFKDWRQGMAATPRKADLAWSVLQRIFSVALDDERITRNPCEAAGRLAESGTRKEIIWNAAEKARMQQHAPKHIYEAFLLAWWTGQRQGDLLRLTWANYDGHHIRLKQGKGGRRVTVRVSKELKAMLDRKRSALVGQEIASMTILTTEKGSPWTESGFRASWRKVLAREEISIRGKTFHDLRGTFITEARRSGSSIEDIADMSGHSITDVRSILEAHYLATDEKAGNSVILKMERKRK